MATLNTVHTLQLTTEELHILCNALREVNNPTSLEFEDSKGLLWEPSEEAVALEKLLVAATSAS